MTVTDGNGNDISANASHVGNLNPFRYRGYYYDTETGLFYVGSRYYDPEIGRFINADSVITSGMIGCNLFAYCMNNPVNMVDNAGTIAITLTGIAVVSVIVIILATPQCQEAIYNGLNAICKGLYNARLAVQEWLVPKQQAEIIPFPTPKEKKNEPIPAPIPKPKTESKRKGPELHHIVAQFDYRADPARDILERENINIPINSNYNVVYLPGGFHAKLHTDSYFIYVNNAINNSIYSREAVIATLSRLRTEIILHCCANDFTW